MRLVFADAAYWIAIANPNDQWHDAAKKARADLGNVMLVTTDEVLGEFLTGFSRYGAALRKATSMVVREIMRNPNVKVIPQTRDSFLKGLKRYESRLDKRYSLQDCISFVAMEDEGITEVLTSDHDFEQEGFVVLLHASTS